jgi:methylenetetrahydrofolate reductase (NADPH)
VHDKNRLRANDALADPIAATIMALARDASLEINVQDSKHLQASRAFLRPGQKIFVSHLPGQTWESTEAACRSVYEAGFDPVPHLPVRLVENADSLDRILALFVGGGKAREILLLSGDYAQAKGPYSCVGEVLTGSAMSNHGIKRLSFAGHPEGHPKVPIDVIRRAEREKVALARASGIEASLVTQFFFEPQPFLDWVNDLRAHDVKARVIGGLAGPAGITTLFKFAMRCGVGPSIRALGIRPTSFTKLMGDHSPDQLTTELAQALVPDNSKFDGLHLFCFGGFLRSCEWLNRVANGKFSVNSSGGFDF